MEDEIGFQEIIQSLKRYGARMVFLVLFCSVCGFGISLAVKKKFKCSSTLNIQNTYFHIPWVNEFHTGFSDPNELLAQKFVLLRMAINDDFIKELGVKYQLFASLGEDSAQIIERNKLKKQIEYMTTSHGTFQISTIGRTAQLAFDLNQDVSARILTIFMEERRKNLLKFRDSLKLHIQSQAHSGPLQGSETVFQKETLQNELNLLENGISAMESQYTAQHPRISEMKQKAEVLRQKIKLAQEGQLTPQSLLSRPSMAFSKKGANTEFRDELVKKLSFIDVVIEMESDRTKTPYLEWIEKPMIPIYPVFPNPWLFLAFGFTLGLIACVLVIGYLELLRKSTLTPEETSGLFDAPFLGILPKLTDMSDVIAVQPNPSGSLRQIPNVGQ